MSNENKPTTSTNGGSPVSSGERSLTESSSGPVVLNDHYLVEQMPSLHREPVPECQTHSWGCGAIWGFE